jgi:hypothetical protein
MQKTRYQMFLLCFFTLFLPAARPGSVSAGEKLDIRKLAKALDQEFFPYRFKFFVYGIKPAERKGVTNKGDWEDKKLEPYLYHVRRKTWEGYFWQVNSSRRTVHEVTGGKFGKIGGEKRLTNISIVPRLTYPDERIEDYKDIDLTTNFGLLFPNTYLTYYRVPRKTQIVTNVGPIIVPKESDYKPRSYVLVDGWNLEVKELKPYLFHLSTKVDFKMTPGFYWQVNTSRKEVHSLWKMPGGGVRQTLQDKVYVQVHGNPNDPVAFSVKLPDFILGLRQWSME